MGPSPTPDLMDPLALFTHGEFLCFDNTDPELLLFTHGEFPRPGTAVATVELGVAAPVGVGRRRPRQPEIAPRPDDEAAITIALLAAEEDDWW